MFEIVLHRPASNISFVICHRMAIFAGHKSPTCERLVFNVKTVTSITVPDLSGNQPAPHMLTRAFRTCFMLLTNTRVNSGTFSDADDVEFIGRLKKHKRFSSFICKLPAVEMGSFRKIRFSLVVFVSVLSLHH